MESTLFPRFVGFEYVVSNLVGMITDFGLWVLKGFMSFHHIN